MATKVLTKVAGYFQKNTGWANEQFHVRLFNADVNGVPTGLQITSALYSTSGWTLDTPVYKEFTMGNTLTIGNKYAIVYECDAPVDGFKWFFHAGDFPDEGCTGNGDTGSGYSSNPNIGNAYVTEDGVLTQFSSGYSGSSLLIKANGWGFAFTAGDIVASGKATNPTPAHQSTGNKLNTVDLSWDAGAGATSYNVYAQTDAQGTLSLIASEHPNTSIVLPWQFRPSYSQTYSWRVDSVNGAGVTTGDTWTWDTVAFKPMTFNPAGGGFADVGGGGVPAGGWSPGGAIVSPVTRLIVAARNKIFYEDI